MGAANPEAAARKTAEIAKAMGLPKLKIAAINGQGSAPAAEASATKKPAATKSSGSRSTTTKSSTKKSTGKKASS